MRTVLVDIGKKTLRCEVPETRDEYITGLSSRTAVPDDEGMLFDFTQSPTDPDMWMRDTQVPLDMIGVSDDGTVLQVERPKPMSTDHIIFPGCAYVVETAARSGIRKGDTVEIDWDSDIDDYVMKVLAPDGTAQMLLKGGERIFSRVSTRKLISRAKKAYAHRGDSRSYINDCRRLGEYCFEELRAQDNRPKEYVKV